VYKTCKLQILRGEAWCIDSLFDCKTSTPAKAQDTEQCAPDGPQRVVEEAFNPALGHLASAVIYRSLSPDGAGWV
jgi:hypothetical protein